MAMAQIQPTEPGRSSQSPQLPAAVVFAKFPLGGLAQERESRVETPKHEVDSKVARIIKAWEKFQEGYDELSEILLQIGGRVRFEDVYEAALNCVNDINCSASDLRAFVEILTDFQYADNFYHIGAFISALINTGSDRTYVVQTGHLDVKIRGMGAYNEKDVTVYGNVGELAGIGMKSGRLTIVGDTMIWAGCEMKGGILVIRGNSGFDLGVQSSIGQEMTGGEIHITGWQDGISEDIRGGRIFVRGMQIYPFQYPPPIQEVV